MAVRDFHTRSVLREERKRVTVNTNTSHHHLRVVRYRESKCSPLIQSVLSHQSQPSVRFSRLVRAIASESFHCLFIITQTPTFPQPSSPNNYNFQFGPRYTEVAPLALHSRATQTSVQCRHLQVSWLSGFASPMDAGKLHVHLRPSFPLLLPTLTVRRHVSQPQEEAITQATPVASYI